MAAQVTCWLIVWATWWGGHVWWLLATTKTKPCLEVDQDNHVTYSLVNPNIWLWDIDIALFLLLQLATRSLVYRQAEIRIHLLNMCCTHLFRFKGSSSVCTYSWSLLYNRFYLKGVPVLPFGRYCLTNESGGQPPQNGKDEITDKNSSFGTLKVDTKTKFASYKDMFGLQCTYVHDFAWTRMSLGSASLLLTFTYTPCFKSLVPLCGAG